MSNKEGCGVNNPADTEATPIYRDVVATVKEIALDEVDPVSVAEDADLVGWST